MNPLLVIGRSGQLARALQQLKPDAVFLDRAVMDLSYPGRITAVLEEYQPYAVINAAAYTQVDNAEKEEKQAFMVNAESPAIMASYCASHNLPFVSFSSDYVFDGNGDVPWKEADKPAPLNAYGRSKLESEKAIANVGGKYLVFRTSWVYDAQGKNFFNTILRLASEREELRIINDQYGAPTYAPHLARAVLSALEFALGMPAFPFGIYNLCNSGVTTWYGFACAIIERAREHPASAVRVKKIYPIPASEYPLPAKRPFNSRLDCTKIKSVFNISMPSWQQGVQDCMKVKYENH